MVDHKYNNFELSSLKNSKRNLKNMSPILIDSFGYLALIINLYSMSTRGEYKLRLISLVANMLYIMYGILINATPVIVGCTVAVFLHTYHIRRLRIKNNSHD